jgi:hypothetical protein
MDNPPIFLIIIQLKIEPFYKENSSTFKYYRL